ncbi:hypothetical protein PYCCODRAFT_1462483 [Trametes coccinea BRFM310]|uniref:Uncharacterized protein n=1 Tax=Trametes coccinea (strain BRFM310) TaxID=1353009 RepID=A0A1Y2I551_TRAC3|nr:hypothetical protein PYCCODRAFT_1462483 [Trametes coccinea BRFM310]
MISSPSSTACGESPRPHVDVPTPRDGYICCVHETLATVVEHIFTKSPGIKDDPIVLQRCHDALKRIYAFAGTAQQKGKERPCVAMSLRYPAADDGPPQRPREVELRICIMGTFDGKPFEALDALYQHFCIAVAPNRSPRRVGEDESSETPWTHPRQWIVAYEYRRPSAMCSTWPPVSKRGDRSRKGASGGDSATEPVYWLDDEQLDWFRAKCAERMEAWSAMCTADPGFALACEREFRENRFMASQSSLASRTSWGSFNTRGTRSRPGTPLAAVPEGIPSGSPAASPRPELPRSCRGRSTKEKVRFLVLRW